MKIEDIFGNSKLNTRQVDFINKYQDDIEEIEDVEDFMNFGRYVQGKRSSGICDDEILALLLIMGDEMFNCDCFSCELWEFAFPKNTPDYIPGAYYRLSILDRTAAWIFKEYDFMKDPDYLLPVDVWKYRSESALENAIINSIKNTEDSVVLQHCFPIIEKIIKKGVYVE